MPDNNINEAIRAETIQEVFASLQNAMIEFTMSEGFSRQQAEELVHGTFQGSAALLSKESISTLIAEVTTPGGVTAAALSALEKDKIKDRVKKLFQKKLRALPPQ